MSLLKNGVGRPPKDFLKQRKIFYIGTIVLLIATIIISGYIMVNRLNTPIDSDNKEAAIKNFSGVLVNKKRILATASKQLGKKGSTYMKFYGYSGDWCAMFIHWVFAHTSITSNANKCNNVSSKGSTNCVYKSAIKTKSAAVCDYARWFANNRRFYHSQYWAKKYKKSKYSKNKKYKPVPGDIIFITKGAYNSYRGNPTSSCYQFSHIAIVQKVKNNRVYYIGGNQDSGSYLYSKVSVNSLPLVSSYIGGYGSF